MNKSEFLTCLSGRLPYSKDEVSFMLDIMADIIADGLSHDGQVRTPLGVFRIAKRKSRKIRDISTGELRTLPEMDIVQFKASEKLER